MNRNILYYEGPKVKIQNHEKKTLKEDNHTMVFLSI